MGKLALARATRTDSRVVWTEQTIRARGSPPATAPSEPLDRSSAAPYKLAMDAIHQQLDNGIELAGESADGRPKLSEGGVK